MKRNHIFFSALLLGCLVLIVGLSKSIYAETASSQQPFLHNLSLGATGNDVERLQKYLNSHGAPVAESGPGSLGNETKYYGSATARAVSHFQELHADAILSLSHLTKGTGNFYTATRNFVNQTLGQNSASSTSNNSYVVGGTITGVIKPIVLQNNTDVITVSPGESANFQFPTKLASGQSYSIAITQVPNGQRCLIAPEQSSNGIVSNSDVNITIKCSPSILGGRTSRHTVGGSVSGLSGTVVLQNNDANDLSLSTDGSFTFTKPVAKGKSYDITVSQQPSGQTCIVTNGTGTMGGSNITNVGVSCSVALVSITIAPSTSHLPRTIDQQFTAFGHYADSSTVDITSSVAWDTSNHSIAMIDGTGLGTGVAAGVTQVTATLNGVIGNTSLTVTNATLVSITISPFNPAVARGSTLQLSAIGTFSDGSTVDLTNQTTWTSTVTGVATVNDTDHKGEVTGVTGGTSSIQARFISVTGTTTLHVAP